MASFTCKLSDLLSAYPPGHAQTGCLGRESGCGGAVGFLLAPALGAFRTALENVRPLCGFPSVRHLSSLSLQVNPLCFHLSAAVDES